MLIERQLPLIYARGSIFNVTAKDLTPEQSQRAQDVTEMVKRELRGDRSQFAYKLSTTIGADYKDLSEYGAGDVDFHFAVWKASLYLLYHYDYTFKCKACGASQYLNKSGRMSKIDQRKDYCPACDCTEIVDPRETGLKKGSFISHESLLILIDSLAEDGLQPPKTLSCIEAIAGKKKHDDPDSVLNDKEQRKKFFTEFVWRYFRQAIMENKIKKKFVSKIITGCSDMVAVECFLAYLRKNNIKNTYYGGDDPKDGYHFIKCDLYSLAPRFTPELAEVADLVRSWGVKIEFVYDGIRVYDQGANVTMVSTEIKTREYVIMETSLGPKDGEKQQDKIESLEDNVSTVAEFDRSEALDTVRNALSDDARKVMDIYSQTGETYIEYEKQFGPSRPKKADIAKFLDGSNNYVNDKIREIQAHWTAKIPFSEL
jgi:hypothetical protein